MVKGKVIDVSGLPSAGVEVRIQDLYGAITDEEGAFIINDVPNGNYFIRTGSDSNQSTNKSIVIEDSVESIDDIIFPKPVKGMFFCKTIQKRKSSRNGTELIIIGPDDAFQSNVGRVFCYTQIVGAQRETVIKHRWLWNDELQSEVALTVRSSDWRTYSSKQILPAKTGKWRVEVIKADDNTLLESRTFVVK
jgi:hypothetical protein